METIRSNSLPYFTPAAEPPFADRRTRDPGWREPVVDDSSGAGMHGRVGGTMVKTGVCWAVYPRAGKVDRPRV
jgi:hypothetical protein